MKSVFDIVNGTLDLSQNLTDLWQDVPTVDVMEVSPSDPKTISDILRDRYDRENVIRFYDSLLLLIPDDEKEATTELIANRFNFHKIVSNTGTEIRFQSNDSRISKEKNRMIAIIQDCYFEAGVWTEADKFFEKLEKACGEIASPLKLLSDIVNHHLSDDHILEGVLHILSNYSYEEIDPYGITISIACATNHSTVIQDLLISCFEKWDATESIDILESLKLDERWLAKYRDEVVEGLKHKAESA